MINITSRSMNISTVKIIHKDTSIYLGEAFHKRKTPVKTFLCSFNMRIYNKPLRASRYIEETHPSSSLGHHIPRDITEEEVR